MGQLGYQVLAAATASDALQITQAHSGEIDLLMTDVVMPGMGGRKLAECMRAIRPTAKTLYLSGYTDDAVIRHGLSVSEGAFLQKPRSTGQGGP